MCQAPYVRGSCLCGRRSFPWQTKRPAALTSAIRTDEDHTARGRHIAGLSG